MVDIQLGPAGVPVQNPVDLEHKLNLDPVQIQLHSMVEHPVPVTAQHHRAATPTTVLVRT